MDFGDFKETAWELVTKWFFVLCWAVLSFIGKLSTLMLLDRKITLKQLIGSAGVTLFFGAMAVSWCDYIGASQMSRMIVVPSICYTSDKLAIAAFQFKLDFKQILADFANYIKNKMP